MQLASEGFGGFLTRNFLKIFGVTPLVGKPGAEKLKENISENVFPKFLDTSIDELDQTTIYHISKLHTCNSIK